MKNLYELLNVNANADKKDIRKAFHRLAKQYHPDLSSESSMFLKILGAYETLIDDKKRKLYNTSQLCEQARNSNALPKKQGIICCIAAGPCISEMFLSENQRQKIRTF